MISLRILLPLVFAIPVQAAAQSTNVDVAAGTGQAEIGDRSGPARQINIKDPFGVEIGPRGGLYIAEVGHHRIWKVDRKTGTAQVIAGTGEKGYAGDGGPPTKAKLNEPYEIRFDSRGNIYFVEMQNHCIRRIDAQGKTISTIAGTGEAGYWGDGGPALKAMLNRPHSIAVDGDRGLYVADIGNHRIRYVNFETGIIETIAGTGERSLPRDGQIAKGKALLGPRALYLHQNVLWIALREGHSVWKMHRSDGRLRHVAGTGKKGFSGDGGPAAQATFNGPKGIAVTAEGLVYVADTENHAIRLIDTERYEISTPVGPATGVKLNRPHGICVDASGRLFIGDTLNHRIMRLTPEPSQE